MVPFRQSLRVGTYLLRQKLARRDKFPLVLELEPLFACNLACAGCGKIQHPTEVLRQRVSVEDAVAAVEECGAPIVSIAGGEPLLHPDIVEMVEALTSRKRFVYLCTNAVLLRRKLDKFQPSPYFAWTVHIDGLRERHDESVCRDGVFDEAIAAIHEAQQRGFRVTTNTTFFSTDSPATVREVLDYLNDDVGVDAMMISPGYAYEKAPDQLHFLGVSQTQRLFREAFAGRRRRWRLNHTPLFLDFLEGRVDFPCTAWGVPSYSVFGWQRPCYLMGDGYVSSYRELVETTDWDRYGRGRDPRCRNCMAHCGYEPSAVVATTTSLRQSVRAALSR
jgi:hopanoid biosynthesis associated radical SAM protein HpnH